MQDCKQQILSSIANNNCCSYAFLNVILNYCAHLTTDTAIISADENIKIKIKKILSNFYPTLNVTEVTDGLLLKGNLSPLFCDAKLNGETLLNFSKTCDRLTLLKTYFVVFGNLYYNNDSNANSKGYWLEFVVPEDELKSCINALTKEFNFDLKLTARQNKFVIYTKNSNIICDLLIALGANGTSFEIQNSLALREMRNSANRQNNCFESNLDKTLKSSTEQLEAINFIIDHYSIDYFDDTLKEIALCRLANPDVSLKDLQTLLGGNISRAGIKYRLDKIIEIYHELKGDN